MGCNCAKSDDDNDSMNLMSDVDRKVGTPIHVHNNINGKKKDPMVNIITECAPIDPEVMMSDKQQPDSFMTELKNNRVMASDSQHSPGQKPANLDEDGKNRPKIAAGPLLIKAPAREFVYEGHRKGNIRDGSGIQRYPDGSVFEGEFKKNKFHGHGKLTKPNGDWYSGRKHTNYRRMEKQSDGWIWTIVSGKLQRIPRQLEKQQKEWFRQRSMGRRSSL